MGDNTPAVRLDAPELPPDMMCRLLAASRRHRILWHLNQTAGAVDIDTLAESIAVEEKTTAERVKRTLVHTHLPKLAEADIIEYDQTASTVALAPGVAVSEFTSTDGTNPKQGREKRR